MRINQQHNVFSIFLMLALLACGTALNLFSCQSHSNSFSIPDEAITPDSHRFQLIINEPLKIDDTNVSVDIAIPLNKIQPAIALILHGNHSKKEAHRNQIISLAKNGITAIALQFRNTNHWYDNGVLLAKLVPLLTKGIAIQGRLLKTDAIVLIGHSFGGYAVGVAAGNSRGIKGVILLDPAMFDKRGPAYLAKISAPVVIIGADKGIFRSRKRDLFFEATATRTVELSVNGATHDDAQNPSMFALSSYGYDPYTTPKIQSLITGLVVDSAKALTSKYGLNHLETTLRDLEKQAKISSIKMRPNSETDQ